MTERKPDWLKGRSLGASLLLGATALAVSASACDDEEDGTGGAGGSGGSGSSSQTVTTATNSVSSSDGNSSANSSSTGGGMTTVNVVGTESAAMPTFFTRPFDATPGIDGAMVYFTGYDASGRAGVFRRNADGSGATTTLYAGPVLAAPVGIAVSSDGTQLFVADAAATANASDLTDPTKGLVFTMPTDGGTPSAVGTTAGFVPRGIEYGDVGGGNGAVFTGRNAAGVPGVFTAAGNAVFTGAPLIDPGGLAVTASGDVFVADSQEAGGLARVFLISGGNATIFAEDLTVGAPIGIALSNDETRLLVAGLDPVTHAAVVYDIDVATKAATTITNLLDTNDDVGGLHRAKETDTFAFVGLDSGPPGSSTIYRIQLQ